MNPGEKNSEACVRMTDISAQSFGKYQFCTKVGNLWYADSDFRLGGGCGGLKPGALPAPGAYQGNEASKIEAEILRGERGLTGPIGLQGPEGAYTDPETAARIMSMVEEVRPKPRKTLATLFPGAEIILPPLIIGLLFILWKLIE